MNDRRRMSHRKILVFMGLLFISAAALTAADKVTVIGDVQGARLQVNGRNLTVMGMNWDYMPIGTTYSYSLWDQPDEIIRAALDREMPLLKAMGVNTLRLYTGVKPRWVQYIYENYGIYTVLNHSFGRYGVNMGGAYIQHTDYADPATRKILLDEVKAMVLEFRNTPGLLFWMLGNENNYGLFWDSAETSEIPGEESREVKRARHMYDLFNEGIALVKSLDKDHPVSMVNGDLLFLDIIAEEVKGLDIFATNMYRGMSFGDAFTRVKNELGVPVVFAEFGSDAFNAVTVREDQAMQARYLVSNWREIYANSYGKGLAGNCLGGFTFQFSDGWWKTGQEYDLDAHDVTASWPNGGYVEDFRLGDNNMNEEWFGICGKGPTDSRGLYDLYPRAAYYALQHIHSFDPLAAGVGMAGIEEHFANIDIMNMELKARGDRAYLGLEEVRKLWVSGVRMHFATYSTGGEFIETPENTDSEYGSYPSFQGFDHLESFYTEIGFRPSENLSGSLSLNILGHIPENPINEIFYENRGRVYTVRTDEGYSDITDAQRVQVYRGEFTWEDRWFTMDGFYRTGHFHWGYEGDFFGLYPEANYGPNIDMYNGNAPVGVEITGKKTFGGLTVAYGPELWWGANPAVLAKYSKELGRLTATAIYQEDLDEQGNAVSSFAVPLPPTRKATLHMDLDLGALGVEVGGIWSGADKIGQTFQIADGEEGDYTILEDEIREEDTYGGKVKLTFSWRGFNWYAQSAAMGLVADGRPDGAITFTGWRLKDSGSGNQVNFLSGFTLSIGNLQIAPNFLYQKPIVGPMPNDAPEPGRLRNLLVDPFAVRGNRETRAWELILNYDPTPATWLYAWDSDIREDAGLAWTLGYITRHHPTNQDAAIGIMADGRTIFAFPSSPPARDLWEAYARIISKASPRFGFIANLYGGQGEPNGDDDRLIERYGGDIRMVAGTMKIVAEAKFNDWGPYDYHRDFNLTYPLQVALDVSKVLGTPHWMDDSQPRFGIRAAYRTLDEYSPRYAPEARLEPAEGSEWEIKTYFDVNIGL